MSQDFLKGRTLIESFLLLSAGRTKGIRGPHAARGPHFAHPCLYEPATRLSQQLHCSSQFYSGATAQSLVCLSVRQSHQITMLKGKPSAATTNTLSVCRTTSRAVRVNKWCFVVRVMLNEAKSSLSHDFIE